MTPDSTVFRAGMFSSLRNRDFKLLWVSNLAASFAMQMQMVARGWLIYDMTGSPLDLTWVMLACNVFIPLLLFSRRIRTHLGALFSIAVAALIGMWLERYVIVVSSLSRGFDPAAWGELYQPTWVEASMTAASFAGFFLLFLVFIKVFPCISISELKEGATEHTEPDDMTGVPERV